MGEGKRESSPCPKGKRESSPVPKGKRENVTQQLLRSNSTRQADRAYACTKDFSVEHLPTSNFKYFYVSFYICDMHIAFKYIYIYIYIHIVLTLCIRCLTDLSARHSTQSRNTRNRRFRWQPQIRPLVVSLSVLFQEEARCQCFHLAAWVPCLFLLLSLQVHLNWLFQPPR